MDASGVPGRSERECGHRRRRVRRSGDGGRRRRWGRSRGRGSLYLVGRDNRFYALGPEASVVDDAENTDSGAGTETTTEAGTADGTATEAGGPDTTAGEETATDSTGGSPGFGVAAAIGGLGLGVSRYLRDRTGTDED